MQYGYFDDLAREYVITTPATPLPWINYLGNEDFLGIISNTGGGYCFYRDAKLQRLMRYRYNSLPGDVGGRFYYIREAGNLPGTPDSSPPGRRWTTMSAATAWVTPPSPPRRMASAPG